VSELERVVAKDDRGEFVEVTVIVRRRTVLKLSCSCWNHRAPFRMEAIETLGGLYFRVPDTGEAFREIGINGPVVIEVESMTRLLE
jgi:hypothetical protein